MADIWRWNTLSYFEVLTDINLHYSSVTMKQQHCESVKQVSLQKLQRSVIKQNMSVPYNTSSGKGIV